MSMLKNRKLGFVLLIGLVLLTMLSLVACGGGAAPAEEEAAPAEEEAAPAEEEAAPAEEEAAPAEEEAAEEEAAAEETAGEEAAGRLALVLPGPLDDNSWNEAAYIALQALGEQGVDTAFSENISDADAERILRTYADEGYEMVIGHSFGFQDAVFAVAEDYPDINFAWAGGIGRTAANVADYDQPFYEAAYAIGVLAGYMSESGVLGAMYGFDIPVCHAMGEAFLLGAQTVNPDAQLIQTAVGDWVDVAKAKEAALAQADAGVDFWIECGEGPALGTIEAAKEAGGYVTGYVGDMTENGPDVVLVNLIWNLEPLFAQMLEDTHNGTFDNPFYRFGVAEGAMLVEYNDALMDQIPQEAIDAVAETMDGIAAGEIEVPFIPESSE